MSRPIVWALGTFMAFAGAATLAGNRVASLGSAVTASPGSGGRGPDRRVATGFSESGATLTYLAGRNGHFLVDPVVEGRTLRMMVDTGASIVALTAEDASAAGLRPLPSDYRTRMSTANGVVAAAPVRIREMRLGDIVLRDVSAVVMPAGVLGQSLLGMSFLSRLRGFDMAGGRLTLRG